MPDDERPAVKAARDAFAAALVRPPQDVTEDSVNLDPVHVLRVHCEAAGSQAAFARAHDLSQAYVNDVLASRRLPGESILAALGLERVVTYRRRNHG